MNPDASIADPGLKMEAYYDEKAKRWIFPGEDPAEVAKPLAPPPTMPAAKKTAETPVKADANDPLAALMSPPVQRTPNRGIGGGGDEGGAGVWEGDPPAP